MIGAGGAYGSCGWSEGWKQRLPYSNYGSRVDVQGWGECVYTTGYGDAWSEPDCEYTSSFSGTSSATPIVAGACILIQSYAIRDLGGAMLPEEMRSLLIQTGQPQVNPSTGHIGPLPDAYAAISSLPLNGACCVGTSGACLDVSESLCLLGNGIYQGDGSACAEVNCLPEPDCPADIDGDNAVNVSDLLMIIDQWGQTNSLADVNEDGIVNVSDLLIVIDNWGPCE
jgi:hypothetical protein